MKSFVLTFLFLILSVSSIIAQEKTISESEFNEIISKSTEQLKNTNYRLTITEEWFPKAGEKSQQLKVQIEEKLRPNTKNGK